ncbi:tubby C-terminal domain-like protein [Lysinibacillus sp. 54212]|uniref:tubby C-terminal domain-like protein n=1 Tax=Lysinibacillus sp. 54212 TaxID=3119829 RepID=UPI002FC5C2E2
MKTYTYTHPSLIQTTEDIEIYDEQGMVVAIFHRVYDNKLKKLLDNYFDYRYFLKYKVKSTTGEQTFSCKKMIRRGKVWFEAFDIRNQKNYIISYENWRIGVPELFINSGDLHMKIDKEMDDWSLFYVEEKVVAKWKAVYDETKDRFTMVIEIDEESPIQSVDFFAAIGQATLFIGT